MKFRLLFALSAILSAVTSAFAGYDAEVLTDTPRVYYKLNESSGTTANDSSGNATNASYTGGVTLGATGPFSDGVTAAAFDGTDDYIPFTLPSSESGAFAVEAWIYETNGSANFPMIMTGAGSTFDFRLEGTTRKVHFGNSTDTTALSTGTWYHVVGTCDGTDGRIYVNGVLTAGPNAYTGPGAFTVVNIGRRSDGFYWPGRLSRVALYGGNLSAARVLAHYNAGIAELPPTEFSIGRSKVLTGSGTVTLTLTGSGTTWGGGTTFALSGTPPTGWSVSSQNITSATAATLTLNRGSGTGAITVSDGSTETVVTASTVGTTIGPGNTSDTAIWDTKERPGTGHTAVIAAGTGPVVIDTSWSTGDVTINADTSVLDSSVTFTRLGNTTQGNAAFDLNDGHLVFDTTAADRKWILGTVANQTSCVFSADGGSISRIGSNECWIDGGDEGTGTGITNTTSFDVRNCAISDLGKDDGSFAIRMNDAGTKDVLFLGNTFTRCAGIDWSVQWGAGSNKNYRIEDNVWEDSITASENIDARLNGTTGSGTRSMLRNAFDTQINWGMKDASVEDNAFFEDVVSSGSTYATWERNLMVQRDNNNSFHSQGSMTDCYLLSDQPDGNPHYISASSAGTFDGLIFDYPHPLGLNDGGDPIFGLLGNSTITHCLILPSYSDGNASGNNIVNPSSAAHDYSLTVEHNTIVGNVARIAFHEGLIEDPDFLSIKSNLISAPGSSGDARAAIDFDQSVSPPNSEPVLPANTTKNYLFNPIAYTHPVTGLTTNGYRCYLSSAPTGDILDSVTGPQFVDDTRSFATWAVHKGAAVSGDTLADKLAASKAIIKADPTLIGSDLIPWVRGGYAPQNEALHNTGHDGVTIGAVEGSFGVQAGTLTEDSHTDTTVTLSWTDATGGTPPYTYDIEKSPAGAETWTTAASGVTSPYTVTGLDPETEYDFRLKVTDSE